MRKPSFTIFSGAATPGWAAGFRELLEESAEVLIVDSLGEAIDSDADVLVLNLGAGANAEPLDQHIDSLRERRVIAMDPGADRLCRELDELEIRGGSVTRDPTMLVVDSELLGAPPSDAPMRAFTERQEESAEWNARLPSVYFGGDPDYRPDVDYILVPTDYPKCAVVMR